MTDTRTSFPDLDLAFIQKQLASLQADVSRLSLKHTDKIEMDLSAVKAQLGIVLKTVRGMDVVVSGLSARLDVSTKFHERLAALEALVEHLPERRQPPGNNGTARF